MKLRLQKWFDCDLQDIWERCWSDATMFCTYLVWAMMMKKAKWEIKRAFLSVNSNYFISSLFNLSRLRCDSIKHTKYTFSDSKRKEIICILLINSQCLKILCATRLIATQNKSIKLTNNSIVCEFHLSKFIAYKNKKKPICFFLLNYLLFNENGIASFWLFRNWYQWEFRNKCG